MRASVVLTVPESKRLIAKGVAQLGSVQTAMRSGLVCVATGTTNGCVAEELLGRAIEKPAYVTGITLPSHVHRPKVSPLSDMIFEKGELTSEYDRHSVVRAMKPGDVFIKGANLLNYEQGTAGVLIGDPNGGTVGGMLGGVIGRRINLVIPVGLEKDTSIDIGEAADILRENQEYVGSVPTLWPIKGHIITEIEALYILTGVTAMQIGAGGVGGAEGGVRLLIDGDKHSIDETLRLLEESIYGEPMFLEV